MTRGLHNRRSCKRNGCPVIYEDRGPNSGIPRAYCSTVCHEADKQPKEPKARQQIRRTASSSTTRSKAISPASPAQREVVRLGSCIVTGMTKSQGQVDPAHIAPRGGKGGCDDPLCIVPLARPVHAAFDEGRFDLLPYLVANGLSGHMFHALDHYALDAVAWLERLTGCRVTLTPKTELLSVEDLERKWAA